HYSLYRSRTLRTPPISPLFPYTTLFRSEVGARRGEDRGVGALGLHLGAHAPVIDGEGEVCCQQGQGFAVGAAQWLVVGPLSDRQDRKSTRLNSSHRTISYAVFCLKKKNN